MSCDLWQIVGLFQYIVQPLFTQNCIVVPKHLHNSHTSTNMKDLDRNTVDMHMMQYIHVHVPVVY